MRIVESHGRNRLAVGCGNEGCAQGNEREDSQDRTDRGRLAEGVAVGEGRGKTANLSFGVIGEDTENGLTFEVGDAQSDRRNVGHVRGRDWDNVRGFDGDAAVDGAKIGNIGLTGVDGQIKSAFAVGEHRDIHHDRCVLQAGASLEVEEDGHVVLVVGEMRLRNASPASRADVLQNMVDLASEQVNLGPRPISVARGATAERARGERCKVSEQRMRGRSSTADQGSSNATMETKQMTEVVLAVVRIDAGEDKKSGPDRASLAPPMKSTVLTQARSWRGHDCGCAAARDEIHTRRFQEWAKGGRSPRVMMMRTEERSRDGGAVCMCFLGWETGMGGMDVVVVRPSLTALAGQLVRVRRQHVDRRGWELVWPQDPRD
nr:hypothetical protein CFP56_24520 [Quercus suber]